MLKKTVIIVLLLIPCCSPEGSLYIKTDKRLGSREMLNYEYSNAYYLHEIRRNHFFLNIEINKPVLLDIKPVSVDNIYPVSGVRGEAIVSFIADEEGNVTHYSFRKRAGLEMDKYIIQLIKSMRIKPVSQRGANGSSEFTARFVIKPYGHY